jgi:hypothetical protein
MTAYNCSLTILCFIKIPFRSNPRGFPKRVISRTELVSELVSMPSNVVVMVSPPLFALHQCSRSPCARVRRVSKPSNVDVMVSPPLFALQQCSRSPCARVRLGPVSRSDCVWRLDRHCNWNTRHAVVLSGGGLVTYLLKQLSTIRVNDHAQEDRPPRYSSEPQ